MKTLFENLAQLAAKSEKTTLVTLALCAVCFIAREGLRAQG